MVKVSKQLFKTTGFFILVFLIFSILPYKKQITIAKIPLKVGGEIPAQFGDVIIVPGGGCNPGRGTEERLNLASALYQSKKRTVILSEGTCYPHERDDFIERMTARWKIDKEDIIWDTLSFTTEENIINTAAICRQIGLKHPIIATSPYHQLRCLVLMYKHWDGDFKVAKMPKSMLEMNKEQVYIDQKGKTLKEEYLKIIYELIFYFSEE